MEDRWYKNGLIYEISVRTFNDSNGDGIGDFPGLIARLDYLSNLGVTCIWLAPFFPSPWRDDGYDVTDHYGVHPSYGNLGDFVRLLHEASDRGIRVIIDLVLNHTSNEHLWFQMARRGDPAFRDYYVWSDRRPRDAESGVAFPGVQRTTWSYDRTARSYYFHRFYDFQPDLNVANPRVRDEMKKIIEFWLSLGISGYRVDAVPFLIEPAGAEGPNPGPRFEYIGELRQRLSWWRGDAVLLGEANVDRDAIEDYYTVGGLHMLFNFTVNQHLWLALAREDARPIVGALKETVGIPESDQWATFLRNHDEIDLGRLAEDERADCFRAFGPERNMQLFGRGIRRRLAPMLGGDRRRLELAFSLLLTLPGTPVLYSGDEIGMGEDLSLPERYPVRTAMQWSAGRNGGFSTATRAELQVPVIHRGSFGYRRVNVADQQRDPASLLSWLQRTVGLRADCPEIAKGHWDALGTGDPAILAIRYSLDSRSMVAVHNLSKGPRRVSLGLGRSGHGKARTLLSSQSSDDGHVGDRIDLEPFGYRWIRVGAAI